MTLRVTLWGQRARDFSISYVGDKQNSSDKQNSKPIVVLFVGCLAKHFQGCISHSNINTSIFIYRNGAYRYFSSLRKKPLLKWKCSMALVFQPQYSRGCKVLQQVGAYYIHTSLSVSVGRLGEEKDKNKDAMADRTTGSLFVNQGETKPQPKKRGGGM
jgi:hypothetical protein